MDSVAFFVRQLPEPAGVPLRPTPEGGWTMPDRRSLTVIGLIYGAVTAIVMLVACLVVTYHMAGRLSVEAPASVSAEAAPAR